MNQLKPGPANSTPLTPIGFLGRAATIYGDCPSVVYNSRTYTWSETHERCLRVASSLVSLGIKRGQVVSVASPNVPAMYEAHFAVPMAGAVLNTINLRLDARMISILLHHSESKLILVDYQSASLVVEALSLFPPNSQLPRLVLITDDGDSSSIPSNFYCSYEALVETGDPCFKWVRPESDFDSISLNYTSGTTSSPKGVVHCHRGIFTITVDSLIEWSVPKEPVYLWTLPMFHANGWSFPWGMAAVGGTNICLRKFDAAIVYSAIRKYKVTHMCGAPVVLNMISSFPRNEPLQYPVRILTAGAPPPAPILFRTESLGFVVMMHPDGYLEIKDRSKDVIISGGENLSSVEVESVLYTHPAVNEAAVVARPDEFWGETPCAFVSLKVDAKGKTEEKDVIDFCRGKLPKYMVPKTVVIKDELPKTSTGKIQKYLLREMAKNLGPSKVIR
ncbi:OLC1v1010363C1 [Oldenlandia corymbosa var. corymbosa]|uniref:OLC1v1010363C1 n=1 Tax=Oldenlandia corymbosa var. corymbosa TaxID=529605 RepID=A0AAV1DR52_OLDCO|nr:OLC1v1010363C1 [Oldenlandia corymbosa var. corymbosa]